MASSAKPLSLPRGASMPHALSTITAGIGLVAIALLAFAWQLARLAPGTQTLSTWPSTLGEPAVARVSDFATATAAWEAGIADLPEIRPSTTTSMAQTSHGRGGQKRQKSSPARCTHGGKAVPCLDVSTCPAGGARRPAIVHVFDCHVAYDLERPRKGQDIRGVARAAKRDGADLVLLVPKPRLQRSKLSETARSNLVAWGIKIMEADWVIPPNLSRRVPIESGGCCGAREFMKLHAFALEPYDVVALMDSDIQIAENASLRPIFDCAAAGYFLSTRSSGSAVNGGFIVSRTSRALKDRLVRELSHATVLRTSGWNGVGWGPFHVKFDARMQGFMYYFFHQRGPAHQIAAEGYGWPAQVDACIWNAQSGLSAMCREELCGGRTRCFHHGRCIS